MVWGAIGLNFKSKLIIVHGNENSEKYIAIIKESRVIEELNELHGAFNYYFQEDAAPCHTSAQTRQYMRNICSLLSDWPPNSPDMSPIEMIWGIMKKIINICGITTIEEITQKILDVWQMLPFSIINGIVLSFHGRLLACVEESGKSISFRIRNHDIPKTSECLNYLMFINEHKFFTPAEDNLLDAQYKIFGPKWNVIKKFFVGRSDEEIKNRFNKLQSQKLSLNYLYTFKIPPLDQLDDLDSYPKVLKYTPPMEFQI
jgi:hypothetical protein